MADALKSFFSPALVRRLAADIARVHPTFPAAAFIKRATTGLQSLELLDRGKHISRALAEHLPADYPRAVEVLIRSLGPEHPTDELVGVGMAPFFYLPHTMFVAERGLDHFDISMRAQYELTKRFSAEASVRPYIARDPERTFALFRRWAGDRESTRAAAGVRGHAAAAALGAPGGLAGFEPGTGAATAGTAEGRPDHAGAPERGQQPERPGQGPARPAEPHLCRLAERGVGPSAGRWSSTRSAAP